MATTLDLLLANKSARLLPSSTPLSSIDRRLYLSKRIAHSFTEFEAIRDSLVGRSDLLVTSVTKPFLKVMADFGIADDRSGTWRATDGEAKRYLTGGWLEEYVAAAASEAGADEVFCGQKIAWESGG